jgi:hypothetical protein
MAGKYQHLICYEPKALDKVPNHAYSADPKDRAALGEPVPFFMNADLVEGATMSFGVRQITSVPEGTPDLADAHAHEADSAFCLVGSIKWEVTLGDEKYIVDAPGDG